MRCPNCGFENDNTTKVCARCNQSFEVYEGKIPTYPSRAGWKKKFRKLSYPLGRSHEPRIKDEKQQENKRFDGKIPIAIFFSLIPGLGHLFYGERRRGLIFFSVYLISIFLYIFFLGTGVGSFFLCIFISSIGSAMMDIFRLEKISFTFKKSFLISITLAISVVVVYFFVRLALIRMIDIEPITVNAGYMAPTIQQGDLLLVNRRAYIKEDLKRGDIVEFRRGGLEYIERIVGFPGETVSLKEKEFFINGEPLDKELYPFTLIRTTTERIELKIPPESYYVYALSYFGEGEYGGNLTGCIKKTDIIGRVFMLYQPRDRRRNF